jgi:hypothetical protein
MIRVLLVALGAGIVGAMAGFGVPIIFARDQGLVLLSILTGPFGFILGFALGFVHEAGRQDILSARRLVSLLYIAWVLMSLFYWYFADRVSQEVLFGTAIVQAAVVIALCGILAWERSFRELPPAVRSRQRICASAALVMTAMLFFPPAKRNPLAGSGPAFETGYLFILDAGFDASTRYADYAVDTEGIILQWLLVCAVSSLYYFLVVGRSQA